MATITQAINYSLAHGVEKKIVDDLIQFGGCVTLILGFFSCLQLLLKVGV